MAIISKNNTANRTLTSTGCWELAPDTGVARVPLTTDIARWYSASNAGGAHTGSLTILGLQIDGATADITHSSGTLTLTQTDAFVNAIQSNRAWIASGGVIAIGASARNFKLNRTGGPAVIFNGAAGLTGTNNLTLSNTSGLTDYNYAILAANGAQAGFTGSIVLLDYTALANWTSAAAATLTGCNITVDGVGCLIGTYINGATLGAAGKTLTINNNVSFGGGGLGLTIANAVALGAVTRTLTVNSNTTMSGTVTGTAGVTVAGAAQYTLLFLSGSSSGLTGPCIVTSGDFMMSAANRYEPTSLEVTNATARFRYTGGTTDFNFPVTPTGLGVIGIAGNFSGNGVTFPPAPTAGNIVAFTGSVQAQAFSTSGFQNSKIQISELPAKLALSGYANNPSPAMLASITYTGSGQSKSTSIVVNSENNGNTANLTAGTYAINSSGSGALSLSGTITRTNDIVEGVATSARMSLTLGGSNTGDNTLSGDISETAEPLNGAILGITKVDAGRWVLSGANSSHTGIHTINAGTLSALSARALGSATSAGGVTIQTTGVLELGDGITLDKSATDFDLRHSANPVQTAGTSTLQTKQITLTVTPTFTVPSGRKLTIAPQGAGVIIGASTGITKAGDGELELTAKANTYTGAVTVLAGTLTVGSVGNATPTPVAAAWGQASSEVAVSGTLKYNGGVGSSNRAVQMTGSAPTLDASGSGALTLSNVTQDTIAKTMTLRGTSTDANTISNAIANNTGAVSLAKEDAGKWVLSGALSYTGTTTVNGGTLRIQTANSNTTLGAVTIGASGTVELITDTLAGTGATSGEVLGTGNVIVNGGTIKTRGGTTQKGQVRYGGNLIFDSNSTLYIGAAA